MGIPYFATLSYTKTRRKSITIVLKFLGFLSYAFPGSDYWADVVIGPYKGSAPYTFPRGWCSAQRIPNLHDCRGQSYLNSQVPSVSEADEECGRKPNERQTLPGFFPHPVFRRSSPVFFVPPASVRKIHPPPGGGYMRAVDDRPYDRTEAPHLGPL